ncbi:hypothetical protein BY996DRAFT_6575343 [Phakopsora pachyrhizi]|nr:hypothetical protein BY996DRAFT_6575343 [Phakopsora pachyrhizi]
MEFSQVCLDITTPDNEYDRGPTNRNKKFGLNAGQTQWVVVTRGDLLAEVYPEEAQTDRLDYDLRGWEPVEYEYLKVYPAVNSESKISEFTEDRDLIRLFICVTEQIWGLPGSPIHRWSYQLPFINHFETIHTGPLVSLISHGGLSVGLSLMDSL